MHMHADVLKMRMQMY